MARLAQGPFAAPTDARDALAAFLETYRQDLGAGRVDRIAAAYRTPLPVVRPDRVRVIETPEALRAELQHIIDLYRWSGMVDVRHENLRIDGQEQGLWLASLTWRPLDATGEPVAAVDVTYVVRLAREGARIAALIAHNEERQRQPILREALDVLGGGARPALEPVRKD
jgi:hypothetical protein